MQPYSEIKPKGILKKPNETPDKNAHLRWDEDNIRVTEAQKDAKMKVDEPPTPYIRYNPELDADLQEMEDLRLASDTSRSSSVASSPKRAQISVPNDCWTSDSDEGEGQEDEEDEEDEEGEEGEEEKARHERFRMMRARHYRLEGKYVHQDAANLPDSDASINSADNAGSSDDDNDDNVDMRSNGNDAIRRSTPHAARAGQANGAAVHPQDFDGGVDEANASSMEL
ncbi:hypothetical protein GGI12_002090 [Dipsacomyces acuminosporus]|nr:hypothetical protein GGI12_002090 [Dipsacomyces acuminosporus]